MFGVKNSDAGVNFSAKKMEVPPSRWATKKPGERNTPGPSYEKTARPLASPCISRSHQQLANTGTQLSKPDRRQARRAARPFS